ncbi:MAG: response regulator transcription factor [Ardenticatenaceae bacterium]|nr:response regulator transcription factor [Ardenticatenaceae bacterium]MCB9442789.1 response regulator transcription factor [Ardenticatenaceae bacterium]
MHILVCLPTGSAAEPALIQRNPRIDTFICDEQPEHLVEIVKTAVSLPSASDSQSPETNLTTREWEVLRLIAMGYPNRQIAQMLTISVRTVEAHRYNIQQKLGLQSNADLIKYAIRYGVIKLG